MKIALLGTGLVGRTVAANLVDLGHEVTVQTRSVKAATHSPMFNIEVAR